jgi:hypothetical protein
VPSDENVSQKTSGDFHDEVINCDVLRIKFNSNISEE